MKKILVFLSFLVFGFTSHSSFGQEAKGRLVRISTTPIKAEVVGLLRGHKTLAVIKVLEVDSLNPYELEKNKEVLVEFYYSTGQVEDEPAQPGLEGGETMTGRISGRYNESTSQYDYRVFEYKVLKPGSHTKSPEEP